MEKIFAKPSEAADALGLGRSKTYQLIANGTLPSVRIGKSIRVPIEALRRWAEDQSNAAQGDRAPEANAGARA
jgi:excisionase family DNA binding protein